jgi:hypothetical protein
MATLEVINIGTTANDGEGDPLRVAFEKVNNNFINLWGSNFNTLESITDGDTAGQVIFTYPVTEFTQATFQINSSQSAGANSQNIVINAGISNDGETVKWTGHSTTFNGNAVTRYSMDVADGNVNLYADPLVDALLTHFIAYQVTFNPMILGSVMVLDQNTNDALGTENLLQITTETPA